MSWKNLLVVVNILVLILVPLLVLYLNGEKKNYSCDNSSEILSNTNKTMISLKLPRNCQDIQKMACLDFQNRTSGVYKVYLGDGEQSAKDVFCDMATDNGGWLVIQRRSESDNQTDFYRGWNQYANGFGNLEQSFWLGLDTISTLTNSDNYTLRIDLMDWEGEKRYAEYESFRVDNASELYRLHVEIYRGDAGDSLMRTSPSFSMYHDGKPFSTKDRDNDNGADEHCANNYHGAWWYDHCHASNLNGYYGPTQHAKGVHWHSWKGHDYSLKRVEMKIRPVKFKPIDC